MANYGWSATRSWSGPKGPYEWGGPKPDGYEWPPGSMQPGAFLVCDRCAAAVPPNATARHDEWHARHDD